jgi:hypothetical protein
VSRAPASDADVRQARERLTALEKEIEEVRRRLAEMTGEVDEPRFSQVGSLGGPVDDTIAPPG